MCPAGPPPETFPLPEDLNAAADPLAEAAEDAAKAVWEEAKETAGAAQ